MGIASALDVRYYNGMDTVVSHRGSVSPLGAGFYTAPEAARLLQIPLRNVLRWLGGYSYWQNGELRHSPPLWTPDLPNEDGKIELSFRDLIELRFIDAFTKAGVGLKAIRQCLDYARSVVESDRPFSTQKFRTDGRRIFLESIRASGDCDVLDLASRQYNFKPLIDRTFKDLDIEDSAIARWRPFQGRKSIVIDPARAFGQPIATRYGVPTAVLFDAVRAEGSVARVASLFEVSESAVKDAERFEKSLQAA